MMQNDLLHGPAHKPEDGDRIFVNAMERSDIDTHRRAL